MKHNLAILVATLLAVPAGVAAPARSETVRPDIVLIICDQLNPQVLSCYGGAVHTPNIDRLAREGVQFLNAVCPMPFCSPSRASIVTGQYPHEHGITYNVNRRDYPTERSPAKQKGIKVADVTTERLLHVAGYETHFYGKWHLLDDDLPYYPDMFTENGAYAHEMADDFAVVRKQPPAEWMNWYQWALPIEQTAAFRTVAQAAQQKWKGKMYAEFAIKMGRLKLPAEKCFDVRVADQTVECIHRARTGPLMLTCSFNAPHDPNVVASPYYEMFDPAAVKLPANSGQRERPLEQSWSREMVQTLGEPGLREFLRIYYASVKLVDGQVGRVLRALEESGRLDSTLVVFTADHGDMAGGHGMIWKSNPSFYDEIMRVPLLMRCPRLFRPQRSELAVDHTDLMPTLLSVADEPIPAAAQGQNLVPFLTGRDTAQARPYSYCERVSGARGSFAVRGQGWKYIRYENGQDVLYDLSHDPGEMTNLAGDPAGATQQQAMIAALKKWQRQTGWNGK